MIFGYYGELLQKVYLSELEKTEHLSKCVTAYRRIEDTTKKKTYKITIHFAHEVFEEIKVRASKKCWVLKFDIDKFFSSMDHSILKRCWMDLLKKHTLPEDHYNVFKAVTKFSYILKDDLRIHNNPTTKKVGFDENKLAENRKCNISALYASASEFREDVKNGRYKIYKNGFVNKQGQMMGIPQGLPVSATLANIYLLKFDLSVLAEIVINRGGYYRRYSDDIIIICDEEQKNFAVNFIKSELEKSKVNISSEKTEQFCFYPVEKFDGSLQITSHKFFNNSLHVNKPLTYLGFDLYGYRTLIKSANLSKFYRRMINAVKSRSKRAVSSATMTPGKPPVLFKRRLYKLYTNINLDKKKVGRRQKKLVPNKYGFFVYETLKQEERFYSNNFTYGKRAAKIMDEKSISRQVRRHRTVFNQAIERHHNKNVKRYLEGL